MGHRAVFKLTVARPVFSRPRTLISAASKPAISTASWLLRRIWRVS
jgi:hypothetical protein